MGGGGASLPVLPPQTIAAQFPHPSGRSAPLPRGSAVRELVRTTVRTASERACDRDSAGRVRANRGDLIADLAGNIVPAHPTMVCYTIERPGIAMGSTLDRLRQNRGVIRLAALALYAKALMSCILAMPDRRWVLAGKGPRSLLILPAEVSPGKSWTWKSWTGKRHASRGDSGLSRASTPVKRMGVRYTAGDTAGRREVSRPVRRPDREHGRRFASATGVSVVPVR